MFWVITSRIKTTRKSFITSPLDLSQNCLFMTFTPPWVLDWESDQLSIFSLCFFVFQGVGGSPGVPALPAFYRRRGSYLSKGCTLSVSFLAIDLINGPDHTHSPQAVSRRPGLANPLLDKSKQAHTDCPSSWLNPKSQPAHRHTRVTHMARPLSRPGPTAHDLNTQSS